MRTINIKWKVSLLCSILLAVFIFNGLQYAQNNSDDKDSRYNRTAKDLTAKLSKSVDLTEEQAGEVRDILVDYQKDIADKFETNTSAENTGNKEDISEEFRDLDKETNDKIEKTFSGNELTSYMNVKKDWWVKIKDKVYSREFFELVSNREDAERDENTGAAERDRSAEKEKVGNRDARVENEPAVDRRDQPENRAGDNELTAKFEPFAKEMATDLMEKMNLSLQQAADVQDALVDYQKSVADLRLRYSGSRTGSDAGEKDNRMTDRDADRRSENIVGSSRNNEEGMPDLSNIDESAIGKLEDVLNDNQKAKFERVKNTWWKEVKDKTVAQAHKGNPGEGNK